MRPISEEKRADIIRLKSDKKSEKDIAYWIGVSVGTVRTIWSMFTHTGEISAQSYKGRKSKITDEIAEKIIAKFEEEPSTTLKEMIELFNLDMTEGGLSKWANRHDLSFKKRLYIQKHKTGKM